MSLSDLCTQAQLPHTPTIQASPTPPAHPPQPQNLQRQAEKPGRPSPRSQPVAHRGSPWQALAWLLSPGCCPRVQLELRSEFLGLEPGRQSPGSCHLRTLAARSQPSLGDAEWAICCEIKGPPAPLPGASPGPVCPPQRPLPACQAPGFSKQPTSPRFPPNDTYPPSPNAPVPRVSVLPRLLLPLSGTRSLAFRTRARLRHQPRVAQGSRLQSGFPTRPRRAVSSPRARAEPRRVWSPRAPGTALARLAPNASGLNGHVPGESRENG